MTLSMRASTAAFSGFLSSTVSLSLVRHIAGRIHRSFISHLSFSAITSTLTAVKASIGEVPIVASEQREAERRKAAEAQSGTEEDDASKKGPTVTSRVTVLADGTYATQTIVSETEKKNASAAANLNASRPPLRGTPHTPRLRKSIHPPKPPSLIGYILDGDYYTAVSIASALTKLALRLSHLSTDQATVNGFIAEARDVIMPRLAMLTCFCSSSFLFASSFVSLR